MGGMILPGLRRRAVEDAEERAGADRENVGVPGCQEGGEVDLIAPRFPAVGTEGCLLYTSDAADE